jgi:Uma2 family endonuclease
MANTTAVRMSEEEYREFALGDKTGQWELVDGLLREKPWLTAVHGQVVFDLMGMIAKQLDRKAYTMRISHARLRVSSATYYVPDLAVIPLALEQRLLATPYALDAYSDSLPLVIEIWSPSTGDYDIYRKLPGYQQRGDLEIWYVHPYRKTLNAWRRGAAGTYSETVYHQGVVGSEAVPGVDVDLDVLLRPNDTSWARRCNLIGATTPSAALGRTEPT